jgi:hypothetical protein
MDLRALSQHGVGGGEDQAGHGDEPSRVTPVIESGLNPR